jgi:hypothetical protein
LGQVLDRNEIGGIGNLMKNKNKYFSNRFFLIRIFTMPKSLRNKKTTNLYKFWNPFPTWMEISEKEKTCTYPILTRRPIYNCSRIFRASRASLIPINRPLTFEEKDTQALRKNQRLHQEGGSF